MRLFFGIFPPRRVQQALAESQSQLRGNWKPVRLEQLHLTLAFLGEVPAEKLDEVVAAGEAAAASSPPFGARVRGTGFFPAQGRPRVWFARVEGEGLEPLAGELRNRLGPLLGDDKPFKAHITLARRKGPAPRVGPVVFDLEFPVGSFSLVRSTLKRGGPVYEPLHEFFLKGA
ncbi:RNA 2',3'-cyclic phosphodiesterase [Oceanithermus sp.]